MAASGVQGPSNLFANRDVAGENWRFAIAPSNLVLLVLSRSEESNAWHAWSCMLKDEAGMVDATALFCAIEGGDSGDLSVIGPWVDFLCSNQHDRLLHMHGMCTQHNFVVVEACTPIEMYLEDESHVMPMGRILEIALGCIHGFIAFQETMTDEVARGMDVLAVYIVGGRVKVTADVQSLAWGIERNVEKLGRKTQYMAPEILNGKPADQSSDTFSFGILLWTLATHQTSWTSMGPYQVAEGIQNGFRPRIPHASEPSGQKMPPEYWILAKQCWSQQREKRPSMSTIKASVEEMILKQSAGGYEARQNRESASQEEIVSNSNSASDEFGLPVLIPIQSSEEQHNIQTRVSIETQENEQRTTPGSSQGLSTSALRATLHGLRTAFTRTILHTIGYVQEAVRYGRKYSMSFLVGCSRDNHTNTSTGPAECVNGLPAPQEQPALGVPVPSGFHPYQSSPFAACPSLDPLVPPLLHTPKHDPWEDPKCVPGVLYWLSTKHWSALRGHVLNILLRDEHRDPLWSDIVVIAISCEEAPSETLWQHFLSVFFHTSLSVYPQNVYWRTLLEWLLKPIIPTLEANTLSFTDLEESPEDSGLFAHGEILLSLNDLERDIGLTITTDPLAMDTNSASDEDLIVG